MDPVTFGAEALQAGEAVGGDPENSTNAAVL